MNRGRQKRLLGLSGTSSETTIRFCPEGALDVLITAARCVRAADNEMVVWDGLPKQNRVLKLATLRPQMKDMSYKIEMIRMR